MLKNLIRNKIVVITDGESALGEALARELAAAKGEVLIIGKDKDGLNKLVEDIAASKKKTGNVTPIIGDLSTRKGCEAVLSIIRRGVGTIDLLINNRSMFLGGKIDEEGGLNQFEEMINTNVLGYMLFTRLSIPLLRDNKKPGIINITSYRGKVALPYMTAFSASQFAQVGFTQALQREFAADRIKVMSVNTAGIKGDFDEETEKKFEKLGFSFDDPTAIAEKIVESYNLEKEELVFGKKEKSLGWWNTVSRKSVDSKLKKIRTKILNAIASAD